MTMVVAGIVVSNDGLGCRHVSEDRRFASKSAIDLAVDAGHLSVWRSTGPGAWCWSPPIATS